MSHFNKIIEKFYFKAWDSIYKFFIFPIRNPRKMNFAESFKLDISKIPASSDGLESDWLDNVRRLREMVLNEDVSNFMNWDVIKLTMNSTPTYDEYRELVKSGWKNEYLFESWYGNPVPYIYNTKTSGNLVHHSYSVQKLLNYVDLGSINKIYEIGGGYGSMRRLFNNMGYKGDYEIFDLPEFLCLQQFYLKNELVDDISDNKSTTFVSDTDYISDPIDGTLLIATWSLSEMPLQLRNKLLEKIKFDFALIAFQPKFSSVDNNKYFSEIRLKYNEKNVDYIPYPFVDDNQYMIIH